MTKKEYERRMAEIDQMLQAISERTENMGIIRTAGTGNPEFVDLMSRFEKLLEEANAITEEMAEKLGL